MNLFVNRLLTFPVGKNNPKFRNSYCKDEWKKHGLEEIKQMFLFKKSKEN